MTNICIEIFQNCQSFLFENAYLFEDNYFDYRRFHFMNVLAIHEFTGLFMNVNCRWSCSRHDARVFAGSAVFNKLSNALLPQTVNSNLPGKNTD